MEYYQLEPPETLLTTCGVQILVFADPPRGGPSIRDWIPFNGIVSKWFCGFVQLVGVVEVM